MASARVLPGRKRTALARIFDLRRVSKPQLSWLILVATAMTIALVLLIWLLLWVTRTRIGIEGWWIAQRGLASPVIGYQSNDLGRISSAAARASSDVNDRTLEPALRNHLARSGRRPVV